MLKGRQYSGLAKGLTVACICFAAGTTQGAALQRDIEYTSSPDSPVDIIIDIRPAALCEKASLQAARCLPARDFFGPHKRLANFSGVLWLLGTAGLTGDEHVLIIGNKSANKEAMAGLLFIAGQRKISILRQTVVSLKNTTLSPGTLRAKSREKVFSSTMRADRIVLRNDLMKLVRSVNAPAILDGRSEGEYWGQTARSQRGGHIPGAQHFPVNLTNETKAEISSLSMDMDEMPVSYAHNAYEGLAYLARLEASGTATRLYLEGWAGWASDGALPADSVTFPDKTPRRRKVVEATEKKPSGKLSWIEFSGIGIGGVALALGGFLFGRTSTGARG